MTLAKSIAILWLALASVQTPQPPGATQTPARASDVIRLGVDLVRIDATVTDSAGRHVRDLTADDFQLLQDGRPQRISTFDYVATGTSAAGAAPRPAGAAGAAPRPAGAAGAAPRPAGPGLTRPLAPHEVRRTIALVVDDLGLSFESIARVRGALQRFLDTQIQPGDLVAILRTGAGMGALQQFTSDRQVLQAAVDRVRWRMMTRASPFDGVGELDPLDRIRNELFTAATLGAVRYVIRGLSELPGRKAVVLLSDGFVLKDADDRYGRVLDALRSLVDATNRSGVVVYGIDMRGLVATGPSASDQSPTTAAGKQAELRGTQEGLDVLAAETGGIFIRDSNDIDAGLARILEDQQGYYLLGYVPDESTFGRGKGKFHQLTVRVKRPGLRVRARSGFLSVPDEELKRVTPQNRMAAAVTSPFSGGDIRLQLSSFFGYDQKLGAFATSVMHVDARDLTFVDRPDGTRASDIEILAMTFGENGEVADQTSRRYSFTLTPDGHKRALSVGLVYRMQVPLKRPGPYQLRIALRDTGSDRIGSASRFIDVPDVKKGHLTLSGLLIEGVAPPGSMEGQDLRDPGSTVAVRTFRHGADASYVCSVYNARRGPNGSPQLQTDVRLYREGVEVFRSTGRGTLTVPGTTGPLVGGVLTFGDKTPPGSYVLELTVSDTLAKKPARATQTIDFEIIRAELRGAP